MKINNKRLFLVIGGVMMFGVLSAGQWNVPNKAKELKNPVPKNAKTAARASKIYDEFCLECHGAEGAGDGEKETVEYDLRDILTMQIQTGGGLLVDGELYWKITHGVGNMPSYAGILTDEERWLMVNHLRMLPPKKKSTTEKPAAEKPAAKKD
ncbi:hypothetical protein MNBD_GAMMA21-2736 [hydrothermal vent metagenome]|uniref:Cytochrome c domain-containing protein n=1 Tax=hydrothermal vent metagenome TaxID=652676 RepID=A0A3B1A0E5_9ZZZZ